MGRTRLITLYHLIFIFQSMIFTMIYASPMIDSNVEESSIVFKDVLALARRISIVGLSQRIASLETKQIIYTQDRQSLIGSYVGVKNKQQEMKKSMEEMRRHLEEIKHNKEEMKSESRELMQDMEEMRSEQRQTKIKMEKMKIQQEEMKNSVKEMRSESREIMQNMEEMRNEKQKIKQDMDEMRMEHEVLKHSIKEMTDTFRDMKLQIATSFQQNRENYDNLYAERDEIKNNTRVPITDITEMQNKENSTLFDMVQRIKYDVDNKHMMNQHQNNFSSSMKAIRNSRHIESVYKQKSNENETNRVLLLDMESNFSSLNQSLKHMEQRIREIDTNMSHLQSQYNEHCTDSSSAIMEIRNSIKQIDLAYRQNINEIDEKQVTLMLHIKSEFRNLKQRFERSNQRMRTLDAELSRLHMQPFVRCIEADYTYIPETEICIKLHKTFMSWSEARKTCAGEKATLIMIRNIEEYNAVKKQVGLELSRLDPQEDCGHDNQIWVGANDIENEGNFHWWNGEALTTWQQNSLNADDNTCPGGQKGADCVVVSFIHTIWDDRNCDRKLPFVCQLF